MTGKERKAIKSMKDMKNYLSKMPVPDEAFDMVWHDGQMYKRVGGCYQMCGEPDGEFRTHWRE